MQSRRRNLVLPVVAALLLLTVAAVLGRGDARFLLIAAYFAVTLCQTFAKAGDIVDSPLLLFEAIMFLNFAVPSLVYFAVPEFTSLGFRAEYFAPDPTADTLLYAGLLGILQSLALHLTLAAIEANRPATDSAAASAAAAEPARGNRSVALWRLPAVLALGVSGLLTLILLRVSNWSFMELIYGIQSSRVERATEARYFMYLYQFGFGILLYWLVVHGRQLRGWVILFVIGAFCSGAFWLGGRTLIAWFVLGALIAMHMIGRFRLSPTRVLVVGTAIMVLMALYVLVFREYFSINAGRAGGRLVRDLSLFERYIEAMNDFMPTLAMIRGVLPSRFDFFLGQTIVDQYVIFLPSALVTWDVMNTSEAINLLLFQRDVAHGFTPTLIGEFYINFGAIGVLISGAGLAMLTTLVMRFRRLRRDDELSVAVYCVFVSGMFYLLKAGLSGQIRFVLIGIGIAMAHVAYGRLRAAAAQQLAAPALPAVGGR